MNVIEGDLEKVLIYSMKDSGEIILYNALQY